MMKAYIFCPPFEVIEIFPERKRFQQIQLLKRKWDSNPRRTRCARWARHKINFAGSLLLGLSLQLPPERLSAKALVENVVLIWLAETYPQPNCYCQNQLLVLSLCQHARPPPIEKPLLGAFSSPFWYCHFYRIT